MERWRAEKGEIYWYIQFYCCALVVDTIIDGRDWFANGNYERGNYFKTKEEALKMIEKLNAVLKGADVIEMPSEEEIEEEAYENNHIHKERGDCNFPNELCVESFKDGANWLKSKIVK